MSFSTDIKNELCALNIHKSCCMRAELCAIICFGTHIRDNCLVLRTENHAFAERIAYLTEKIFHFSPVIIHKTTPGLLEVQIADETTLSSVLTTFDLVKNSRDMKNFVSFHFPDFILQNSCCLHAVLRGAFLTSGSCAEPEKRYHLEISTNHFKLSREFLKIMQSLDIQGKIIARKANYVIYLKGADYIHDFLGYAGAMKSVVALEETRVTKEFKNTINRKTNFEVANLTKTVYAGNAQIEAIEKIQHTIGLSSLDDSLQEVALLRLDHPDASLKDLSKMLSMPISKSGINHRLKKLVEIAENLRGGKRL